MDQRRRFGTRIDLDGNLNLRDLGGWAVPGGRSVAYGRLYRSDRLSDLTDRDLALLDGLAITTVIDLRNEHEVAAHPSRLWASVTRHIEIPMSGDLAEPRSLVDRILDGEIEAITIEDVATSYTTMLSEHATGFGRAIDALLHDTPRHEAPRHESPPPEAAALFHCTAGKDRTGLLAMLVLSSVGVSDDDVLAEFALTNRYRTEQRMAQLRPLFGERGVDIERFRPALSAPEPALKAALDWLRRNHGSPEAYLEGPAGVHHAGPRLRDRLLADV